MEKTKNMKQLFYLFVLISTISYSQEYTGLAGYLTVENNVWRLSFQNNERGAMILDQVLDIKDMTSVTLTSKDEVEQFYNDLTTAIDTKDGEIKREKYRMHITKKNVFVFNNNQKYTTVMKRYSKPGLTAIQESISYMN